MDMERLKNLGKRAQERADADPKELGQDSPERIASDMEFSEALASICTTLMPRAEILAEGTGRTVISCLSSILRKELGTYVTPGAGRYSTVSDNRERKWLVKIWFWDVTAGDGEGELIAENDAEIISGLPALGVAICEYAQEIHGEDGYDASELPEFGAVAMAKRMGGMHPAISKGGGEATLRVRYAFGDGKRYVCQADVSRA